MHVPNRIQTTARIQTTHIYYLICVLKSVPKQGCMPWHKNRTILHMNGHVELDLMCAGQTYIVCAKHRASNHVDHPSLWTGWWHINCTRKSKSRPLHIHHNMMVILLSNDLKVCIFHFRFSLMPCKLTYAVKQAMWTDDDKEADKTIEPSSNGSRKAMLPSNTVELPWDMLAHVMMCCRGLGLGCGCSQRVYMQWQESHERDVIVTLETL